MPWKRKGPAGAGHLISILPGGGRKGPQRPPRRSRSGGPACDVRAVMAENARLRSEVSRLRGENRILRMRCGMEDVR